VVGRASVPAAFGCTGFQPVHPTVLRTSTLPFSSPDFPVANGTAWKDVPTPEI